MIEFTDDLCVEDVTKVQAIGKDVNGNYRYMIYITKSASSLCLKKGDKVLYRLQKLNTGGPVLVRNPAPFGRAVVNKIELTEPSDGTDVQDSPSAVQSDIKVCEFDESDALVQESVFVPTKELLESTNYNSNIQERDFLAQYNRFKETNSKSMCGYLRSQAEDNFGKDRVAELLDGEGS